MSRNRPPRWLERILLSQLPLRDRETVTGDLQEEFRDRKLMRPGTVRAEIWYARQVLSFLPRNPGLVTAARRMLIAVCLFTAASGAWLGVMDFYLQHAGYAGREWIAGTIVFQGLLTLVALRVRESAALSGLAKLGTLPILSLAARAAIGIVKGNDIEGYILLIALGLIFQTVLTLYTLRSRPSPI